ncbi:hypothetical protein PAXRUDRAFT_130119 [Paxillus rubicundulus Ve08.2h10]|uniref:Uncharacterized protein n=1 Tax=Paxillus rubicundulus Ve08.2h10 TaxID=930991 RepID=A0A0D0E628_9AGAM|nr:hypothetical protein PAXRUDRAFT_130119 [Paxillus rubicundulus Ve08.2h10]
MLSIMSTLCLDVKCRSLAEADAATAVGFYKIFPAQCPYFSSRTVTFSVRSSSVGFLPLVVAFSLPQTSYMWGGFPCSPSSLYRMAQYRQRI